MKKILLTLLISGLLSAQADGTASNKTTTASGAAGAAKTVDANLAAKLKQNITVEFKDCAFTDAINYLRKISGVNFIVLGHPQAAVTLCLKNMPLEQVVQFLGALTGMEAVVEKNAVIFRNAKAQP